MQYLYYDGIFSVLGYNKFVLDVYCVNDILRARYCNLWWYVRKGYGKYIMGSRIFNIHENS